MRISDRSRREFVTLLLTFERCVINIEPVELVFEQFIPDAASVLSHIGVFTWVSISRVADVATGAEVEAAFVS